MSNIKVKIAVGLCFIINVVGCGGSDSSGEQTSEAVDDILIEEEEALLIEEAKIEMSELVADTDFNFSTKQQIDVSLDLTEELEENGQTGKRAYVSIYRDYQLLESEEFYPNASSRVVAGELNDGLFEHSLTNLDGQTAYLIEVWFYDGEDPLQKELQIDGTQLIW